MIHSNCVGAPSQEALFGEADDISDSDDDMDAVVNQLAGGSQDERDRDDNEIMDREGDDRDDDEEGEGAPQEVPEDIRIEVELPRLQSDLGDELHFVKLPNFLSVETRPFDPAFYEEEMDEDEVLDEEGRTRLKLKVENTMRWRRRLDAEGNEMDRESNARIVRWSDGSMSLHLGKEVFDVYKTTIQGDHNHLFIRQGTGLQGQAVFKTKLTFRPHSTDSATHRKMTLSIADRCSKTQKIRVLPMAGKDPETQRAEKLKVTVQVKFGIFVPS